MKTPKNSLLAAVLVAFVCVGCSANEDEHDDGNDHQDAGLAEDAGDGDVAETSVDADLGHSSDSGIDVDVDTGSDVEITPAARAYCECMLLNCHDPFHEKWGVEDPVAIANCEEEASALPVAGSEQTSGDNIECRQFYCDEAAGGGDTCPSALGEGQCQ